ncbi:hypothetical protein BKN14_00310 [Candidatus Gracilibacteria bacterium HOT-871]|nr:hypothetical protein BKN14_00310 [Candidatus Gracilibacteria bacterium HOT-871]
MEVAQYRFTGDNESYTYPSLIYPLIDKIEAFRRRKGKTKQELTIWLPFDTVDDVEFQDFVVEKSNYYKILKEQGYNVIASHIATGQDFFDFEPENFDLIISNPPFKNKKAFFERALIFKKPFALVGPASWLNDSGSYDVFSNIKLQLFMSRSRPTFFRNGKIVGKVTSFKAIYFCFDFLEQDIDWFLLDKSLDE